MLSHIVKRDGRLVPFDRRKISFAIVRAAVAVGGRDQGTADRLTDQVVAILERRYENGPTDAAPTVEEVQDVVEKVLIENGHAKTAKAYIVYRYEHTLKRHGRKSLTYSSDNVPYRKLWQALSWAVDNGVHTLGGVREYVKAGQFDRLAQLSEAFYAQEIAHAVTELRDRLDEVRMLIVSGPSSSGKTTTTIKIGEALPDRRFVPINVDNYFFDLETHPRDPRGDVDFETPQALDMELLNDHLRRLLAGEQVKVPYYDFKTGRRTGVAATLALEKEEIILIDSLHGFFEPMTEAVPAERKLKLYIETLGQIKDDQMQFVRWTDVRMLRRMVRDMQFRSYNPEQTLRHWYLVRRSELRHIVSRLHHADVVVNSFMPCELPIMKRRVGHLFPGFVERLAGDPEKSDALERADRINRVLQQVPEIDGEDAIGERSLLREFIGGSTYNY